MSDRTCSVDGCDARVACKGLCNKHYTRLRRTGSLADPYEPDPTLRFLAKTMRAPSGCLIWLGAHDPKRGYGTFTHEGRCVGAHRVSHLLFIGPIPSGFQVDHLCRNRRCVEPMHLEAVLPRVNTLRGMGPSARNGSKARCIRGHEFTPENTQVAADGERSCRKCKALRQRGYYKRKKESAA